MGVNLILLEKIFWIENPTVVDFSIFRQSQQNPTKTQPSAQSHQKQRLG